MKTVLVFILVIKYARIKITLYLDLTCHKKDRFDND